jgi:hypothetical protein
MGGCGMGGNTVFRFNVAYGSKRRGFDSNCSGGNKVYNNTSYGNGMEGFRDDNTSGRINTWHNNISANDARFFNQQAAGGLTDRNSLDLGITNPGFASTDPASGNFLRLSSTSPSIDVGTPVAGVSYLGSAPDLGAYEAR